MNLSKREYKKILNSKASMEEKHRCLIGNSCYEIGIEDCGVAYVSSLLKFDIGRLEPYEFNENTMSFFRSSYLSTYYKNSIRKLLKDEILDESTINTLSSEKDINDMTEEEIKALKEAIDNYCCKEDREYTPNVSYYLVNYLYKLNGNGPTSYIKNNIPGYKIAEHIMYTSGISSTRPDFYSGRGVKTCDLDSPQLVSIFLKLVTLDKNYAISFAKMVLSMKILGATEFMESFYTLASNHFEFEKENISTDNNSLNSTPRDRLIPQAFATVVTVLGERHSESVDIELTEFMKKSFIRKIKPVLDKIDPNFDYGDYSPNGFMFESEISWYKPIRRVR